MIIEESKVNLNGEGVIENRKSEKDKTNDAILKQTT
jgi:hypothetical protein